MKKTRRWLLFPILAVLAYLGLRWAGGGAVSPADEEPPAAIFNRLWFEKFPDEPTDYLHGTFVLDQQPIGLFQRSSSFDFHVEIFQYDRDNNKLKVTFPQTDRSAKLSYTIKGCDEMPPFDLCLTLSDNPWKDAPKKYYAFRDTDDAERAFPGARAGALSRLRMSKGR